MPTQHKPAQGPPRWRYGFFAALLVGVVFGGKWFGIPHDISIALIVGCVFAIANGELPKWFGKDD